MGFAPFEGDTTDPVAIVEHYATQEGWTNDVEWHGPTFKPVNRYLTKWGYPLDTKVWWVSITVGGRRQMAFGKTFAEAALAGHQMITSGA
jgi:hypothetical protein